MSVIGVIFAIFITIALYICGVFIYSEYSARKAQERLVEENRRKKRIYKASYDAYKKKYGNITKIIRISPLGNEPYEISRDIAVFAETGILLIRGRKYSFEDVVDCTVSDQIYVKKGQTHYNTRTSNRSMIGRAIIGGIVAGDIGAVIGGATAKKKINVISKEDDEIIHDYTININIKSTVSATVDIECYNNKKLADDIACLMNMIINRNI